MTALNCFDLTGSLRMSARAFDIERKYNVDLRRKDIKGKTRYGTPYRCTEYSLSRADAAKIKRILKAEKSVKKCLN